MSASLIDICITNSLSVSDNQSIPGEELSFTCHVINGREIWKLLKRK